MQRNLEILDIPVYMSLGCSLNEQSQPQKVLVSVTIDYSHHSKSESTDRLEDALCYATIAEQVEAVCLKKPYHLIEHATAQIFNHLKEFYPQTRLKVRFLKVSPPHRLLHGGTVYTIEDEAT
jgi:dihydroneopterin aldolase